MKEILTLNPISPLVNKVLKNDYTVSNDAENPIGILVRSFEMKDYALPSSVLAVARAGAGVNNIPYEEYAKQGVVVFNTPGANANAVSELVIASLLLGSRKIVPAIEWVKTLKGQENLSKLVEKGKKEFVGREILGKKLGVIGLGAIGARVANLAIGLNMEVLGYDPYLSVNNALHLSRHVEIAQEIDEIFKTCDYITLHVPLTDKNKYMINEKVVSTMKDDAVIINLARGELCDTNAILEGINSGKISRYITDFPSDDIIGKENVICIPHLGASTPEAEDNCAVMASKQLKDFIENGNIVNSVNYPTCQAVRSTEIRIAICHLNQKNMIAQFTSIFGDRHINIDNFINTSKGEFAYSIMDVPTVDDEIINKLNSIEGVIKIRVIR